MRGRHPGDGSLGAWSQLSFFYKCVHVCVHVDVQVNVHVLLLCTCKCDLLDCAHMSMCLLVASVCTIVRDSQIQEVRTDEWGGGAWNLRDRAPPSPISPTSTSVMSKEGGHTPPSFVSSLKTFCCMWYVIHSTRQQTKDCLPYNVRLCTSSVVAITDRMYNYD